MSSIPEIMQQLRAAADKLDDGSDWREGRSHLDRQLDLACRRYEIACALGVDPRLIQLFAEQYGAAAGLFFWRRRWQKRQAVAAKIVSDVERFLS